MIIPDGYPDRSICIIGLGYVGLSSQPPWRHAS
jgi:hypothetical protein